MDLVIARCAALLAGNGALFAFLSQYLTGDLPIDSRRGAGLMMAFPLIGMAAAYSALYMHSLKQPRRAVNFEWLAILNFLGITILWVCLNAFAS